MQRIKGKDREEQVDVGALWTVWESDWNGRKAVRQAWLGSWALT